MRNHLRAIKSRSRLVSVLSCVVMLALVAGCGSSGEGTSTTGVTTTEITIAVTAPFSGALAPIAEQVWQNAFQVWQDEVNEQGGINGREIKLVKVDNQYTPAGGVAACKQAQSEKAFVVVNMLGTTNEVDCLDAARVPTVDAGSSYIKDWKYAVTMAYPVEEGSTLVSLMTSSVMQWQDKKIGIVYSSDDALSLASFESVKEAMQEEGPELVHEEAITANQPSYVSQMTRMKAAGVDALALLCLCLDSKKILEDALAVGFTPELYVGQGTSDQLAALGGSLFDDAFGSRFYAAADSPAYEAYIKKVEQFGGDAKTASTNQMTYYALLDALGEGLRQAGDSPTREGLMEALHSLENYDKLGMIGPITWNDQVAGIKARFPMRCCADGPNPWQGLGPATEVFE